MIQDTLLTSITVAGAAILWRNLIYDSAKFGGALKKLPKQVHHALTCGFCFTFWLALASVIVFNPLRSWMPPSRMEVPNPPLPFAPFFEIIFSWMIIGTLAVIVRFGYIAIQEFVHYEVHHLNHREHTH